MRGRIDGVSRCKLSHDLRGRPVDASLIKVNKASCVSCIIASWGGALEGGGSTWGVGRACSWGSMTPPLRGACCWGGDCSWGGA
ncbi:UNVERIFIED_CONTAM: hypothetical protein Sradi_0729400 [Sesamum radiatum]|uniref:Uncharacterized protein n=1 Tax=Sesamum radiatum TaxID=300843 RepID=A0AAW2VMN8_SESRA